MSCYAWKFFRDAQILFIVILDGLLSSENLLNTISETSQTLGELPNREFSTQVVRKCM